jgi:hypothetical protein
MLFDAWRDGWRRVAAAPAIAAGVFALTFVLAWPLALTMRGLLEAHLGRSLEAEQAADAVNYDWWQEFTAQANGLGTTFTPAIIGFAATLDNVSSVLDAQREVVPVAGALALYLAAWTFLAGGILDRYARQRPTRAFGFFAASGVYFFRFLRLAVVAGIVYWWLFTYVREWLFTERLEDITRDLSVERTVFLWRALFYLLFGSLLALANVVFDYTKVRVVVEDRRSVTGALAAALRFIRRHPARVFGLYAWNGLVFLIVLGVWAAVAPGAGGAGLSLWVGFAMGQMYLLARLLVKLHFLASETSLFQASLAHAAYTAAPEPVWPESPAAGAIAAPRASGPGSRAQAEGLEQRHDGPS